VQPGAVKTLTLANGNIDPIELQRWLPDDPCYTPATVPPMARMRTHRCGGTDVPGSRRSTPLPSPRMKRRPSAAIDSWPRRATIPSWITS
jgi:hypothetical protein